MHFSDCIPRMSGGRGALGGDSLMVPCFSEKTWRNYEKLESSYQIRGQDLLLPRGKPVLSLPVSPSICWALPAGSGVGRREERQNPGHTKQALKCDR